MINKIVKTTYTNKENFTFTFEPLEDSLSVVKTKEGFETKYLTIETEPENPREWDNLGEMVCFYSKYNLGDKTDLSSKDFEGWQKLKDYLIKEKNAKVILPLRIYDHSGITISCDNEYPYNDQWDSSMVGFIYASKERIKAEGISKSKAERILKAEVKTYDQYLIGDCYCLVKETYNKDKSQKDYDTLGGFYGYKEAQEALKTEI